MLMALEAITAVFRVATGSYSTSAGRSFWSMILIWFFYRYSAAATDTVSSTIPPKVEVWLSLMGVLASFDVPSSLSCLITPQTASKASMSFLCSCWTRLDSDYLSSYRDCWLIDFSLDRFGKPK